MIYGPKKNAAFTFYLPLVTKGATDWKDAPTLAAGDVQVKKDAGAFGNITTLPALDAAGEKVVKVTLLAGEMNADVVVVRFIDQTNPKEWEDTGMVIITTAQGVGLQSGDAYARLGAPAAASVSADVAAVKGDTAAVKVKTDTIPAAGPASAADYTAGRAAKLDAVSEARLAQLDAANVPADAEAAAAAALLAATSADAVDDRLPAVPASQGDVGTVLVAAGEAIDEARLARQILSNDLYILDGSSPAVPGGIAGEKYLVVYADDGVTPLKIWLLKDKDAATVALQGTGPVSRETVL